MAGKPDYAGRRTPFKSGDSVVISLPSRELRDVGIDVDDLVGEDLYAQVEDGELVVDLESAAQRQLTAD